MGEQDRRQMALVAFMQASNVSHYAGSWLYPSTEFGFLNVHFYAKIARTLEEGKFDMLFFDDRLAMPDRYGDSFEEAVRRGARPVKLDLVPILGAMSLATRRIGLGATYSTTFYEPFHIARVFATLDHLSGGRAAWNVVTSCNDSEARNFGRVEHLEHDTRYDRADELMEVVMGLWDSWEDDALVLDRERQVFADPTKVHYLNHEGRWFRSRGPLTVPRSPQGYPVIIQAGQSGRGRDFAARWADCIFTIDWSLDLARDHYRDQKERAARLGRDPDQVKILPCIFVVVGETEAIAREKEELLLDIVPSISPVVLLSEALNYDFSTMALDDPVTDEVIKAISGIRGLVESLARYVGRENLTLRSLAEHRATLRQAPRFVGTPVQIADQMEAWFSAPACDGFVVGATHVPGSYEEFVRLVVPELQRRGLFRREYTGCTLREHLGLPRPERGAWRARG